MRLAALLAAVMAAGCASTTVQTTGNALKAPLCVPGRTLPVAVYWLPRWRYEQKEREQREAAAQKGLDDFLADTPCLATTGAHRLLTAPQDEELVHASPRAERYVVITLYELGPLLEIGVPSIVRGGTEVVLDVKVLDPRAPAPLAASRTRWRHGGLFYLKGTGELDKDMAAALRAALSP
jgi:hypothetical protein